MFIKCLHFYQLIEYIEKYNIIVDFIYNWNEKDFLIDYAFAIKRIISLEAYESDRITHALQNDNREFISFLTYICVNDIVLSFALIYRDESIQDTWLNDWNENEQTFFAISFRDWSCDELEYKWLMQIFDRCTKSKNQRRRLLIVNDHSNHVNLKFISKCDELKILLMILSFHSIHRLQSLNVSLFFFLAVYYIKDFNSMINNSLKTMNMSKRVFWDIFWSVWQQIFIEKNIASIFKKTDIWSCDSDVVLNKIIKKKSLRKILMIYKHLRLSWSNELCVAYKKSMKNSQLKHFCSKFLLSTSDSQSTNLSINTSFAIF